MYKILICDDETDIRNALNIYLSAQGYETVLCANGQEALDAVEQGDIGLVLLDIMMPVMDGITVLSKLRKTSNVPVILLTAKGEDTDKVLGLDVGADDYITKPFNPMEVLARVKSQLRRYLQLGAAVTPTTELHCGPVSMDDRSKAVTVDGAPISLTPTEYEISQVVSHPSRPGVLHGGDLPSGLEGSTPGSRGHRGRTYPAPARKNRDRPSQSPLPEGGLGPGL